MLAPCTIDNSCLPSTYWYVAALNALHYPDPHAVTCLRLRPGNEIRLLGGYHGALPLLAGSRRTVASSQTLAPSPRLPSILGLDRDSHVRFRAFRTRQPLACRRRRLQRRRTGGCCHERTCGRRLDVWRGRCGASEGALSGSV